MNENANMGRRNKCTVFRFILFTIVILLFYWVTRLYSFVMQYQAERLKPKVHLDESVIRKLVQDEKFDDFGQKENLSVSDCEIPYLKNRITGMSTEPSSCKRLKPQANACKVADELFPKTLNTDCSNDEVARICWVKGVVGSYSVECAVKVCAWPLFIATFSDSTGELDWQTMANISQLQSSLNDIMNGDSTYQNHGFSFIKCVKSASKETITSVAKDQLSETGEFTVDVLSYEYLYPDDFLKQLLVLPPSPMKNFSEPNHNKQKININLMFLDSVSRHHFFRSLPQTTAFFEKINKYHNTEKQSALVLDYHLSQSVKTRTYESLQALLGGHADPQEVSFGMHDMPNEVLRSHVLFGLFKNHSYQTLWVEDLCYQWEWGLSKDLLVHDMTLTAFETLTDLKNALKKAAIDELGVTFANCEILYRNEVNDNFHGPEKVCYGGRHQHEYALEYLRYYQSQSHHQKSPFFTFYETNVGHEDTGRRIQTFDRHLTEYLEFSLTLDDMVTVIFSDHGNTYGAFVDSNYESHVEMFHPHMFILIPQKVQKLLGSIKMESLISNQNRLVSLLDLHFTLRNLADVDSKPSKDENSQRANKLFDVSADGLFSPVASLRSCEKMPSPKSGLCICEGFDNKVSNDSYYSIVALFAIGQLNNLIHRQYKTHHPSSKFGFGLCHRLVPYEFHDVTVRFENNFSFIVKMEIEVKLDKTSKSELFFVAVRVQPSVVNHSMELLTYQRITAYSKFSSCADKGVDLSLCICSDTNPPVVNLIAHHVRTALNTDMEVNDVEDTRFCVYVIVQKSGQGVTIDVTNVCKEETFILDLVFFRKNMIVSNGQKKIRNVLKPGDVQFVLAAVQKDTTRMYEWQYLVEVMEATKT